MEDNKILVSFDFDSFLWNLEKHNLALVKKIYNVDLKSSDVYHYGFYHEFYPKVVDSWSNPDEYKRCGFIDGALDFFKKTQAIIGKDRIQIITASYPAVTHIKDDIIKYYLGLSAEQIIHESDKYKYSTGTVLVDDHLKHLEEHVKNNPDDYGIIFDNGYGWNQTPIEKECDRITRAFSYDDVLNNIINNIELKEKAYNKIIEID
jgi:hypothetical protein